MMKRVATWDREKDLRALIAYHKKNNHPLFMPRDGWCNECCRDIVWKLRFDYGKPFPMLVTGCPRCNKTYCD